MLSRQLAATRGMDADGLLLRSRRTTPGIARRARATRSIADIATAQELPAHEPQLPEGSQAR